MTSHAPVAPARPSKRQKAEGPEEYLWPFGDSKTKREA